MIARVEASTVDELGKLVIAKIQDVSGITRTPTCTVVHVTSSMARRTARALATGTLVLGVAGGLLSGCPALSRPLHHHRPAPAACTAAASRWPETVSGKGWVETTADSPAVAAWGDPPVIAWCGLAAPAPTTQECQCRRGGLGCAGAEDGAAFTTFGRDPAIEVSVPDAHAPEPLLLPAFGEAARAPPRERPHLRPTAGPPCDPAVATTGRHSPTRSTTVKVAGRRCQRRPVGRSSARVISSSMSSGHSRPDAAHICGYIECGVKPGIVLISLTITSPRSV